MVKQNLLNNLKGVYVPIKKIKSGIGGLFIPRSAEERWNKFNEPFTDESFTEYVTYEFNDEMKGIARQTFGVSPGSRMIGAYSTFEDLQAYLSAGVKDAEKLDRLEKILYETNDVSFFSSEKVVENLFSKSDTLFKDKNTGEVFHFRKGVIFKRDSSDRSVKEHKKGFAYPLIYGAQEGGNLIKLKNEYQINKIKRKFAVGVVCTGMVCIGIGGIASTMSDNTHPFLVSLVPSLSAMIPAHFYAWNFKPQIDMQEQIRQIKPFAYGEEALNQLCEKYDIKTFDRIYGRGK